MTNQHDKTNCCMLCEHHSREAIAARAEVLALKQRLSDAVRLNALAALLNRRPEYKTLMDEVEQLETELEESRKAGDAG